MCPLTHKLKNIWLYINLLIDFFCINSVYRPPFWWASNIIFCQNWFGTWYMKNVNFEFLNIALWSWLTHFFLPILVFLLHPTHAHLDIQNTAYHHHDPLRISLVTPHKYLLTSTTGARIKSNIYPLTHTKKTLELYS